jgi:hypothetical protein
LRGYIPMNVVLVQCDGTGEIEIYINEAKPFNIPYGSKHIWVRLGNVHESISVYIERVRNMRMLSGGFCWIRRSFADPKRRANAWKKRRRVCAVPRRVSQSQSSDPLWPKRIEFLSKYNPGFYVLLPCSRLPSTICSASRPITDPETTTWTVPL